MTHSDQTEQPLLAGRECPHCEAVHSPDAYRYDTISGLLDWLEEISVNRYTDGRTGGELAEHWNIRAAELRAEISARVGA